MKTYILGFIVFLFLFLGMTNSSFAQSPYSSSYQTPTTDADVPQNLNTYSQSVLLELSAAVSCQLFGMDPMRPNSKCLGVNSETGKIGFVENGGGAIGVMGHMIASLYNIPVSTSDYTRYLAGNFLPTKNTLAQSSNFQDINNSDPYSVYQGEGKACDITALESSCGSEFLQCVEQNNKTGRCERKPATPNPVISGRYCDTDNLCPQDYTCNKQVNKCEYTPNKDKRETGNGYGGLESFAGLWVVFRNIVYLFYVVIFVVLGLGIMLRLPVDQRAVMTIQNQIPKIIISLVLVSLSLPIAGFLIDIMYLAIFLVFGLLNNVNGTNVNISDLNPARLQGNNPLDAIGGMGGITGIAGDASNAVGDTISTMLNTGTQGRVISAIVLGLIGGAAGSIVPGVGNVVGLLGGLALGAFANHTLGALGNIIAFFIIGFALFSSLLRIWFKLLQSYILFLFNVILAPFWIFGGLIPGVKFGFGQWFRSTIGYLSVFPTVVVMFMLGKAIMDVVTNRQGFTPPLIGGGLNSEHLAAIIGLGVILATPSIMDNVKNSFGAKGISAPSIGQAIGTGQAVGGAIFGGARGVLWRTNRQGLPTGIINRWIAGNPVGGGGSRLYNMSTSPNRIRRYTGQALSLLTQGTRTPPAP